MMTRGKYSFLNTYPYANLMAVKMGRSLEVRCQTVEAKRAATRLLNARAGKHKPDSPALIRARLLGQMIFALSSMEAQTRVLMGRESTSRGKTDLAPAHEVSIANALYEVRYHTDIALRRVQALNKFLSKKG